MNKEVESTFINTFLSIAGLLCFNILAILLLCGVDITISQVIYFLIILFILSYFYYVHNKRWKTILLKFENNDPYPVLGKVLVNIYFFSSFILLFIAAHLKRIGVV